MAEEEKYKNYTGHRNEFGKDADGNRMSQYGYGNKGGIHRTQGGYTTIKPDGNNHHHGDHALDGAYSKDGSYSNKRR